MAQRLGIAVVGCGRISASHLQGITEMQDAVKLVATVDVLPERAQAAADKHGAQRWYGSAAEAFRDPEVEAVILALPHYLHHPVTIQALRAGKHVLVEKLMANTYRQAVDMVQEAEQRKLIVMVGQSRRYFDAVQESKRRLGKIGKVVNSITVWNTFLEKPATEWWTKAARAGGLLIPLNGSHAVDYVSWIMEKQPVTVYARTLHVNPSWQGEDEATMVLDYGSETATIHLSFNTRHGMHTRVLVGTKGTMTLNGEQELTVNGEAVVQGEQRPSAFAVQVKEFADSIREGREPQSSGRMVAPTIAVLDAARLSAVTGQPVSVKEMMER